MPLSPPPGFQGRFLTDIAGRSAYSEGAGPFRILPAAVAIPADRGDLCALVRHASAEGIPLTPRGAGSGMPGGNLGPGVIVDLASFDRPARVALSLTANVGAAVTCRIIDEVGGHFGFRLPPDPSSGAFCTVGGMIATNAAGARSLACGSIRRWVRGVEFVTADGECGWLGRAGATRSGRRPTATERRELAEHLQVESRFAQVRPALDALAPTIATRFPKTTKNAAGYALDEFHASRDLLDLVIGSEGTLGIVTRAELQLERVPDAAGTLLVALPDLNALGETVQRVLERGPVAVELLDRTFLDLAGAGEAFQIADAAAVLIVEFEGRSDDAVRQAIADTERAVASACTHTQGGIDGPDREALWSIRHGASPALAALPPERRSLQVIEDGCVPLAALGRYIEGVHEAAAAARIRVVAFGHAGDGHLHVNALVDTTEPDFEQRLHALLEAVTRLVTDLGGTPSGEHGDGRLRAHGLERTYGPDILAVFAQIKEAFDPAGILNPGVIISADGAGPLAHLKVGPNAAEIPAHVATGLQRIERTAAWHTPRLSLVESAP